MTITDLISWLDSDAALIELLMAWDLTLDPDPSRDQSIRMQVRVMILRVAEEIRALDQPKLAGSILDWFLGSLFLDYLAENFRVECDRLEPRPVADLVHMVRWLRTEMSDRLRGFCHTALKKEAGDG